MGLVLCLSAPLLQAQVSIGPGPVAPGRGSASSPTGVQTRPYTPLAHYPAPVASLAVSPEGDWLAVVAGDQVEIWSTAGRTRRATTRFKGRYPHEIRYLPGNRRLLVAGQGLWAVNPSTLAPDRALPWMLSDVEVTALDVSRDGQTAVVGDEQGRLHKVDLQTGRETGAVQAHEGRIHGVRFCVLDRKIASIGMDETMTLWDGEDFRKLRTLKRPYPPDFALASAQDGDWLAMGGLRVDLFDPLREAEVSMEEAGHRGLEGGLVNSLAFSPDGTWLASGGCDRIINVWDTRSRRILKTFEGTGDQVQALAFSMGRKRLFSGDRRGTLAAWELAHLPRP